MDTSDYTFRTLLLLPLAIARRGIAAGQEHARIQGEPVAIAVLDATGHLVALERMDGAGWPTVEIALGKAHTALAFGKSSEEVEEHFAIQPGYEGLVVSMSAVLRGRFQTLPGGLPLRANDQIIGAVGVSGGADVDIAVVVQREIQRLCKDV